MKEAHMLDFLKQNWSDLLVSFVGLSAIFVYFLQKHDYKCTGGTLIISQIQSVEKNVLALKEDPQLSNISVFYSNPIIKENMWEKYKHIFAKKLSTSEYNSVQTFFDQAEQIERSRCDIIGTITTAWSDKSLVKHEIIAKMDYEKKPEEEVDDFCKKFEPRDLVFQPNLAIQTLVKRLENFDKLTGSSAYSKIQKSSYNK